MNRVGGFRQLVNILTIAGLCSANSAICLAAPAPSPISPQTSPSAPVESSSVPENFSQIQLVGTEGQHVDIFVGTVQMMAAHRTTWDFIDDLIAKTRRTDPNVKIVAAISDPESGTTPGSHFSTLMSVEKAKIDLSPVEKYALVAIRTLMSGGSTYISLAFYRGKDLKLALGEAIVAGTLSGLISIYSRQIKDFSVRQDTLRILEAKKIVVHPQVKKYIDFGEAWAKFFVMEMPFIALLNYSNYYLSQPGFPNMLTASFEYLQKNFWSKSLAIASTAAVGTSSQGVVEAGFNQINNNKIKAAQNSGDVVRAVRQLMWWNIGVSAYSVLSAVLDNGNPLVAIGAFKLTIGKSLFTVLMGAGILNYFWVRAHGESAAPRADSINVSGNIILDAEQNCEKLFK